MNAEAVEKQVLEWCAQFIVTGPNGKPARNDSYEGQGNYKGELFAIFKAAYAAGLCGTRGGVNEETIHKRAIDCGKITEEEPRGSAWGDMVDCARNWWKEWTYALTEYGVK